MMGCDSLDRAACRSASSGAVENQCGSRNLYTGWKNLATAEKSPSGKSPQLKPVPFWTSFSIGPDVAGRVSGRMDRNLQGEIERCEPMVRGAGRVRMQG